VAALLLVALYVGSASAECAWVLWWENTKSSVAYRAAEVTVPGGNAERDEEHSWHILGSYQTRRACDDQQAGNIASMLAEWRKAKAEATASEHTISYERGSNIISRQSKYVGDKTYILSDKIRYLCLPDTVDPRGPKGVR